MKHKHDYKQTGTVEVPTGKYFIKPGVVDYSNNGGLSPVIRKCLVFICDCGDMLIKPVPDKLIEESNE